MKMEKYLEMLSMPRGTEDLQDQFMTKYLLPIQCGYFDGYGNYFVQVGDSNVAFMAHVDTVHSRKLTTLQVLVSDNIASVGDSANCLGADCTTGIFIMLNMIEREVPGLYCFFRDEEVGCLGSKYAAENGSWENIDHAISFDRYGTQSVITHQMGMQTASNEFSEELALRLTNEGLDYKLDDGGVYTDSNEFVYKVANCTNVSVGYYSQHLPRETQDLLFLASLVDVCCRMDWTGLPIGEITDESKDWDSRDYYGQASGEGEQIAAELYDMVLSGAYPGLVKDMGDLLTTYTEVEDINDPFYVKESSY